MGSGEGSTTTNLHSDIVRTIESRRLEVAGDVVRVEESSALKSLTVRLQERDLKKA
jgi:hypothetical protein